MAPQDNAISLNFKNLRKTKSESDVIHLKQENKKSRLIEKITHLIAVVTIIFLSHATIYEQWLLPYYYSIVTPILLIIRIILYWRNKYQYFLLDFCYFANIIVFVYIWIPDNQMVFFVLFGLANGPLIWAMFVYRNAIVFHSLDKLTSSYIHILPSLLSFAVRWYPDITSKYWVSEFIPSTKIGVDMVVGLIILPFVCFVAHSMFYYIVVQRILKPTDEYMTSYSYLGLKEEACLTKLFNCCGKKYRCFMFYFFNWLFCLVTLTGVMLWYNFFIAHCILLVFQGCALIWSGANYYMHVLAVRGFVDE